MSILVQQLLETNGSVYGKILTSFEDLPQYPEFWGFWVLPDGSFIPVRSIDFEINHNSVAQKFLEDNGYKYKEDPYLVMEEFDWCRCVMQSGIFYADPPEKWNRKSRKTCRDLADFYQLQFEIDRDRYLT